MRQRHIYKVLFTKRFCEVVLETGDYSRALRIGNIYASKWTVRVWQRLVIGKMRNVYSPEKW